MGHPSQEKLLKIRERNIETHFETSPPRQERYPAPKDTVPQPPPKDSAKPQGELDSRLNPNSPDGFSLEYVDGMTTPGILPTNQDITFYLRIYNNTSINMEGMTNGFRIYLLWAADVHI